MNFISRNAFVYAMQKVQEKRDNPDLTIDPYRLFNNMLSSMPMCFNLFSDLRSGVEAGDDNAQAVLREMLQESAIGVVERVEIEMIPRPTTDYIDDLTAFDAAVLFRDRDNHAGLASIETKYTDSLGSNRAHREDRKHALADELDLLTADGARWYREHGFDQIARNLLLTLAYAERHARPNSINYVVALKEDRRAQDDLDALRDRLSVAYRDRIRWLPLQDIVDRGLRVAHGSNLSVLHRFRQRYLDVSVADGLLLDEDAADGQLEPREIRRPLT